MTTLVKVLAAAVPVIGVLVAAAFFTPPEFPFFARQVLLLAWALIGIAVAEWLLFGAGASRIIAAMGFVMPRWRAVVVAILVSIPMWLVLPLYGWVTGTPMSLSPAWPSVLLGVILVNGLAEEVIHRAFVFGHLRRKWSFVAAASVSAMVFAAQHFYLLVSMGTVAGMGSVALAFLLGFPLAFIYERNNNSLVGPAVLHTSSNAPMMLFATPAVAAEIIMPYMGVVLASIYLSFAFGRWLDDGAREQRRAVA